MVVACRVYLLFQRVLEVHEILQSSPLEGIGSGLRRGVDHMVRVNKLWLKGHLLCPFLFWPAQRTLGRSRLSVRKGLEIDRLYFYVGDILVVLVPEPVFPKAVLRVLSDRSLDFGDLRLDDLVEYPGTFIKGDVVLDVEGPKTRVMI